MAAGSYPFPPHARALLWQHLKINSAADVEKHQPAIEALLTDLR